MYQQRPIGGRICYNAFGLRLKFSLASIACTTYAKALA